MNIYPAIDLFDGKVVRLKRGRKEEMEIYGDPLEFAYEFENYVDKVHIIDLEGAFKGKPANMDVVNQIVDETELSVQVGGGYRTYKDIKGAYSLDVDNVIISTMAFNEGFLKEVTEEFQGVTVSLDIKYGKIAVDGWRDCLEKNVSEVIDYLSEYINRMIFTRVEKDGILNGIQPLDVFSSEIEMIYAGGITEKDDIKVLEQKGYSGCIIGKALYENRIDLSKIIGVK
ncbi:MAG: HisA/HisF-related TIM barrel protein [Thermoplasmatota archaeon]